MAPPSFSFDSFCLFVPWGAHACVQLEGREEGGGGGEGGKLIFHLHFLLGAFFELYISTHTKTRRKAKRDKSTWLVLLLCFFLLFLSSFCVLLSFFESIVLDTVCVCCGLYVFISAGQKEKGREKGHFFNPFIRIYAHLRSLSSCPFSLLFAAFFSSF